MLDGKLITDAEYEAIRRRSYRRDVRLHPFAAEKASSDTTAACPHRRCERPRRLWQSESGSHQGLVLHSQVKFFAPDLQTATVPLPRNTYRSSSLTSPGISTDPRPTGDFIHPVINADYTFEN